MALLKYARSLPHWLLALLLLLAAAHLLCSFALNEQRFFIPDEIVYFLMSKAMSAGALAIDTGYEQFASPLFVFNMSSEHGGRVYPQYPLGYAVLAFPFFAAFGKAGLFAMNALCFPLILWLVGRIQMRLFGSELSAWIAAALCGFGGFLWLYSQALAPHLLQIALLLAAALCLLNALLDQAKRPWLSLLAAGLFYGAALTVRLDSLFALPMLILPPLFARPVRWRALALLLPGILAALVVLSYTNQIKFGTWMPFSYDTPHPAGHARFKPEYVMLMAAGLAFFALLWGLSRLAASGRLPAKKWLYLGAAIVAAGAVMVAGHWLVAFAYGFLLTVVDYSNLPLDAPISESATRSVGGGFYYLGEVKRALLQSAPFIALCSLLALQSKLKTTPREWIWLGWLMLVPLAFIGFFSLLRWEGGFAYHMRYYLPVLPFFAMIAAQAFTRFINALEMNPNKLLSPAALGSLLCIAAVFYADSAPQDLREWMLLKLPLWLWLGVALAAVLAFYDGATLFVRQCAVMLLAFTMLWGGASSVAIMYPHLNDYKRSLHLMSASYAHYVAPKSVVISVPRYFTSFFASDEFQLYVATIYDDGEPVTKKDMYEMITHFMSKGYGVYITEDMKSFPYLVESLDEWGIRLVRVRPADARSQTPALSQFKKLKQMDDL